MGLVCFLWACSPCKIYVYFHTGYHNWFTFICVAIFSYINRFKKMLSSMSWPKTERSIAAMLLQPHFILLPNHRLLLLFLLLHSTRIHILLLQHYHMVPITHWFSIIYNTHRSKSQHTNYCTLALLSDPQIQPAQNHHTPSSIHTCSISPPVNGYTKKFLNSDRGDPMDVDWPCHWE